MATAIVKNPSHIKGRTKPVSSILPVNMRHSDSFKPGASQNPDSLPQWLFCLRPWSTLNSAHSFTLPISSGVFPIQLKHSVMNSLVRMDLGLIRLIIIPITTCLFSPGWWRSCIQSWITPQLSNSLAPESTAYSNFASVPSAITVFLTFQRTSWIGMLLLQSSNLIGLMILTASLPNFSYLKLDSLISPNPFYPSFRFT